MESSSFCDNYIDISPMIHSNTAIFPGDTPFSLNVNLSQKSGDNIDLSEIKTTVHIGAHADAPRHYHQSGETIESRSLNYYFGLCQVIEINIERDKRILPKDLEVEIKAPRVLFKTNSFPDPDLWNGDFNSLSPELIEFLNQKKVITVGIDTPSVDPGAEQVLSSHHTLYKYDMAVLEGIVLKNVQSGLYQLIALPLKIKNADASPVRAILLPLNKN